MRRLPALGLVLLPPRPLAHCRLPEIANGAMELPIRELLRPKRLREGP